MHGLQILFQKRYLEVIGIEIRKASLSKILLLTIIWCKLTYGIRMQQYPGIITCLIMCFFDIFKQREYLVFWSENIIDHLPTEDKEIPMIVRENWERYEQLTFRFLFKIHVVTFIISIILALIYGFANFSQYKTTGKYKVGHKLIY